MIDLIESAPAWLGYAMIVVGVAMLAYAALWWLWARRKRKGRVRLGMVSPQPKIEPVQHNADGSMAVGGMRFYGPWMERPLTQEERELKGVGHFLPSSPSTGTPYAPNIAGTGSKPVNPLEERVKALEENYRDLDRAINPTIRAENRDISLAEMEALSSHIVYSHTPRCALFAWRHNVNGGNHYGDMVLDGTEWWVRFYATGEWERWWLAELPGEPVWTQEHETAHKIILASWRARNA